MIFEPLNKIEYRSNQQFVDLGDECPVCGQKIPEPKPAPKPKPKPKRNSSAPPKNNLTYWERLKERYNDPGRSLDDEYAYHSELSERVRRGIATYKEEREEEDHRYR